MTAECEHCMFYEGAWGKGVCKRHAPIVQLQVVMHEPMDGYKPVWPTVRDNDGCGDWENTYHLGQFIEVDDKGMPA